MGMGGWFTLFVDAVAVLKSLLQVQATNHTSILSDVSSLEWSLKLGTEDELVQSVVVLIVLIVVLDLTSFDRLPTVATGRALKVIDAEECMSVYRLGCIQNQIDLGEW